MVGPLAVTWREGNHDKDHCPSVAIVCYVQLFALVGDMLKFGMCDSSVLVELVSLKARYAQGDMGQNFHSNT